MDEEVTQWTHSWLRISQVVSHACWRNPPKCIYITLPFPRPKLRPATYFAWLEMISDIRDEHGEPVDVPVCFIRGNGKDVVTQDMQ